MEVMEKILKKWTLCAKADLDAAKRLFNSPRPTSWTYLLVLWHCHQVIEKMLKMLIIKRGKELVKIHGLLRLVELSGVSLSDENLEFVKKLNKYYLTSRYPDLAYKPLPKPDRKLTKNYLEKTKKLFLWLKKQ